MEGWGNFIGCLCDVYGNCSNDLEPFMSAMKGNEAFYASLENSWNTILVEYLNIIKDQLVNQGITENQLEAVLGGILCLTNAIKSDNQNFNMYPRLEVYFRERLSLKNSQVKYIMKYSKNLAGVS